VGGAASRDGVGNPRWRFTPRGREGQQAPAEWRPSRVELERMEAGKPVIVQGRNLRGRSMPDARLRRDQACDWFELTPDDRLLCL
jgi:hypothetical protein